MLVMVFLVEYQATLQVYDAIKYRKRFKMSLTTEQKQKFLEDGYLALENFLSDEDVASLRGSCFDLVETMDPSQHNTVFSTTKQTYRNNYFLNSADKIGYFFEDKSLDEDGKLLVPKQESLNKIGHALHMLSPAFRKVTFSSKMKNTFKSMGFEDPVITQSMYIFKQPRIGGVVTAHQDGTYIYTEPMRVVGAWIALEDTTLDNGCLWFAPGSHKGGLYGDYRMIRNPADDGPSTVFIGDQPSYELDNYIPVPVKKGTMLLLDGLVVHKSEHNHSDKSRHIYTFHVYDHRDSQWNQKNWLQPTEAGAFEHMNDVTVD